MGTPLSPRAAADGAAAPSPPDGAPGPTAALAGRGVLAALALFGIPVAIAVAHAHLGTRAIAAAILAAYAAPVAAALWRRPAAAGPLLRPLWPPVLLLVGALALGDRRLLLLLPTLVSGMLGASFAWSLHRGPPLIERLALLVEPDLPAFTRPYCRRVTLAWAVVLALHAAVAALLALTAPLAWWAAYTGPIFAVGLACLLTAETLFRKCWFRYYGDGPIDRLLARWLPPEATARGRRSLAHVERRRAASESPQ